MSEATGISVEELRNRYHTENSNISFNQEEIAASSTPFTPGTPNNTPVDTEINSDHEISSDTSMNSTDNKSESPLSTDYKSDSIFTSFNPFIFFITNKVNRNKNIINYIFNVI